MDNVNHPAHYNTGKYESIDVMVETQGVDAVKNFCICNAFKYIYRHRFKNGVEDIKKAIWYLNKYVELNELTTDVVEVNPSDKYYTDCDLWVKDETCIGCYREEICKKASQTNKENGSGN